MSWTPLGNPRPRSEPLAYAPLQWRLGSTLPFESAVDTQGADEPPPHPLPAFDEVIRSRRTRYHYARPSLHLLGRLFHLTCQTQLVIKTHTGPPLSHRPAPSAGAIHPIHVAVHLPGSACLHRYDPHGHALCEVQCSIDTAVLRRQVGEVVDAQDGVLLLFVAEPGLTMSKYEDAASLVWRDAGVLLAWFALAAEALGLRFAPLGITGEPWAARLVDQDGLAGVGAALVGS